MSQRDEIARVIAEAMGGPPDDTFALYETFYEAADRILAAGLLVPPGPETRSDEELAAGYEEMARWEAEHPEDRPLTVQLSDALKAERAKPKLPPGLTAEKLREYASWCEWIAPTVPFDHEADNAGGLRILAAQLREWASFLDTQAP